MTRLANRRRSAKKSLRKKNMRKSVKHTKRNNRKTRMSHKRHTRKQRGGESLHERVTYLNCVEKNETNIMNCIKEKQKRGNMDLLDCFATCKPGGEKYRETEEKLAERKRAK